MSSDATAPSTSTAKVKFSRVLKCEVVIRSLGSAPGRGEILAYVDPEGTGPEILAQLPDRVRGSCEWWESQGKKILGRGCEIEIKVSPAGATTKGRPSRQTASADPIKLGDIAVKMAKNGIDSLQAAGGQTGVKDMVSDVIMSASEVVNATFEYLPQIHAAANGDPQGMVMALGQSMMRDPEGKQQFAEVMAAATGDPAALASVKDKAKDMPFGGLISMFFDQMTQKK